MRFSIVIPVYNAGKLALNMIDKVLDQGFEDFEIIAVDDKSTDDTAALLKSYEGKDKRLTIVFKDENSGPALTRNEGLKHVKGEYVLFFDCDDDIEKDLLLRLNEAIEKNGADLIIYGHSERYYKGDKLINCVDISMDPCFVPDREKIRKMLLPLERKTMLGYPWNKAYKRSIISEANLSFENVNMIEDFLFNVDFYKKISSLEIIEGYPYKYNIRNTNSVTALFRKDYFILHERRVKVLLESLKELDVNDEKSVNDISLIYARYLLSAISRNCDKRSGMDASGQRKWLENVFESPLFCKLSNYMNSDNPKLEKIVSAFKNKDISKSLRYGKMAYFVKTKCSKIFSKLKQNR
ncbi:MAG: glycosyltransferase family 2 protein [Lachnospiraceae bacterium]|nr:glycosyltransferase family 2 protein [Lachnospiraceae bacterium]